MSVHADGIQVADHDSFDVIKRSHALSGDPLQLDDFYSDWAESYDSDVTDQRYQGPEFIAALAADAADGADMPRSAVTVLDAGCGTGLVGIELEKAGFTAIDGIDLSRPMVDRAKDTGSYRWLTGGVDLNKPIGCLCSRPYEMLVCCGVFTPGHVDVRALDHLVEAVREDGVLVISTRHSYLQNSQFTEHLDEMVAGEQVRVLRADHEGPYIEEEGASYWVLRKTP